MSIDSIVRNACVLGLCMSIPAGISSIKVGYDLVQEEPSYAVREGAPLDDVYAPVGFALAMPFSLLLYMGAVSSNDRHQERLKSSDNYLIFRSD